MRSAMDRALKRYRFLKKVAGDHATRAKTGEPLPFYREIGVISVGDKIEQSRRDFAAFHDELSKAIEQWGFIEVVAAFEAEMVNRIRNAVGAIRKAVRDGYSPDDPLSKQIDGFVRDAKSFESMSAIEELIAGNLGAAEREALQTIRSERNRLAHGVSAQPVLVSPEDAYRLLTTILKLTGPRR
jgi:hypothetical protein